MAGGELVVTPTENTGFIPEDAAIVGNTCLYGATGGQIFVRGKAGERFAVRNSLAQAVVEGTGDHCCEYMTGGCVVVLGKYVTSFYPSYPAVFWFILERTILTIFFCVQPIQSGKKRSCWNDRRLGLYS